MVFCVDYQTLLLVFINNIISFPNQKKKRLEINKLFACVCVFEITARNGNENSFVLDFVVIDVLGTLIRHFFLV